MSNIAVNHMMIFWNISGQWSLTKQHTLSFCELSDMLCWRITKDELEHIQTHAASFYLLFFILFLRLTYSYSFCLLILLYFLSIELISLELATCVQCAHEPLIPFYSHLWLRQSDSNLSVFHEVDHLQPLPASVSLIIACLSSCSCAQRAHRFIINQSSCAFSFFCHFCSYCLHRESKYSYVWCRIIGGIEGEAHCETQCFYWRSSWQLCWRSSCFSTVRWYKKSKVDFLPDHMGSQGSTDFHFRSPQPDTNLDFDTTDTGQVHTAVGCLFPFQILLVLTAPAHREMAELRWPMRKRTMVVYPPIFSSRY